MIFVPVLVMEYNASVGNYKYVVAITNIFENMMHCVDGGRN